MPKKFPETTHSFSVNGEMYHVRRRGSRYNIFGPSGYLFNAFKSAAVAGSRWEELTRTPWPHASSAYQPGLRLRELDGTATEPAPRRSTVRPAIEHQPITAGYRKKQRHTISVLRVLMLPAPRIDLREQARLMDALRREPGLLFDARVQRALRHEVEYHRPAASWARRLLKMLTRFERRQRARHRVKTPDPTDITAKHIAWQEQRSGKSAASAQMG
jgi:hypothetical protein